MPANAQPLALPLPPANTVTREAPLELLLKIPDTAMRSDSTVVDKSTSPFDRSDPTGNDDQIHDETEVNARSPHGLAATGANSLRTAPTLPQRRGIGGDVRYVFTALFGATSARRELSTIELAQAERQKQRRERLITLGKSAIISEAFDHPAVAKAREEFAGIEEKRSALAGQVAAADAELQHVSRSRDSHIKRTAAEILELEKQVSAIATKLQPIEKDHAAIKKRANDLQDQLARIDAKITATESSIVSVKTPRQDRAAVGAELATMKADRNAVQRDEPVLAAQLDDIAPRIAKLEAERSAAVAAIAEKKSTDESDGKRSSELLDAVRAKRKVVERATAEAQVQRDTLLAQLGERLYVDRPKVMADGLLVIDELDVAYGTSDRKAMELREILSSIDKWKIFRGTLVIIIAVLVVVAGVFWFVAMMPAQ
jgi:chromosome segregation ATPase